MAKAYKEILNYLKGRPVKTKRGNATFAATRNGVKFLGYAMSADGVDVLLINNNISANFVSRAAVTGIADKVWIAHG